MTLSCFDKDKELFQTVAIMKIDYKTTQEDFNILNDFEENDQRVVKVSANKCLFEGEHFRLIAPKFFKISTYEPSTLQEIQDFCQTSSKKRKFHEIDDENQEEKPNKKRKTE